VILNLNFEYINTLNIQRDIFIVDNSFTANR